MRKGRSLNRGLRKGAIVSSSPQGSGYDKLELKHQNLVFFKLIECIIKKRYVMV